MKKSRGGSPQKDFSSPHNAPARTSRPATRPAVPPATRIRATPAIPATTAPFRRFARVTLYPIRAKTPKAMSRSARTHEIPSTRSATTPDTERHDTDERREGPAEDNRHLVRRHPLQRAPRRRGPRGPRPDFGCCHVSFTSLPAHSRGYLTVLGRSSNPSNFF